MEKTQSSFAGGEISPNVYSRVDIAKYGVSLETISNMLVMPQGGVTRRPGTRYVAEAKSRVDDVRLINFIFSRDQSYVIELGDLYARFYMNGGQLVDSSTSLPYEIVTPWTKDQVWNLRYAQSADVMYLVDGTNKIKTLSRSGHTSWAIADFFPTDGPYMPQNSTTTTITASASTGTVTLTASTGIFDSLHIGSIWRLEEETRDQYNSWEPAIAYAVNDIVRYRENVYKAIAVGTAGKSGTVAPVHIEGDAYDGKTADNVKWQYLHSGFGVVQITAVASNTSATATVLQYLPAACVSGTTQKWLEGAWSDFRGYPSAVTLFEQRLWFAASKDRPQTLWGSRAGDFNSFEPGGNDDDAIDGTINARQANPIIDLADGRALFAMTNAREWVITSGGNLRSPISPADATVRTVAQSGSGNVSPLTIDQAIIFADRSNRRVNQMVFDFSANDFIADDLTILADHILTPGK